MSMEILNPLVEVDQASRDGRRPPRLGVVGWISLAIVAMALLLAIFGPIIRPFNPNASDLSFANVGPYGSHLLGFDGHGRDLLSRLIVGARTAIFGAAFVAIVSMLIGTTLAISAAWFGGKFDATASAALDVVFAFPGILLAVLAATVFGPSLFSAGFALAIAYSPYVARILRGAAMKERAMTYIAALEVQGFGAWRLCLRHLLPNVSSLVIAQGTILFGWAVVDLAAVSFLGLGVQTPQADWGVMVSEGETSLLQGYPFESLSAALCIVVVVAAVSFLGDRIDTASKDARR